MKKRRENIVTVNLMTHGNIRVSPVEGRLLLRYT